ncbi:MAG: hypothetical protein DWQ10_11050, partial [Calditrichaeota bacterium]
AINNADKHDYLLVHYNPLQQTFVSKNFPVKFRSFDFWREEKGIAVGENGGYSFENGKWNQLHFPVSIDFKCAKFVSEEKYYICGEGGVFIESMKSTMKVIPTPHKATIRDMDFISENEGWLVGHGGMILHFKDGVLEEEIAESTNNLWAVDMLSADFGFAVGENGTILQYDGDFWDIVPLNTDIDFHDIEMLNAGNGYIVGGRGAILKYGPKPDENSGAHKFLFTDQVHIGSENLMDRITDVYGVTVADFNGDQRADAYITGYKSLNHLLINQGQGYYKNQVIESGTGGNVETRIGKEKYEYGSIAMDFDRDGDTDLFLGGKNKTSTYFTNNGHAVFKTNRESLPIESFHIIDGATGDFDEDGYPDLVLADEQKGLRLHKNLKYNRFEQIHLDSLNIPVSGIRAVKVADLNGDFHQDILAIYQNKLPIFLFNDGKNNFQKNQKDLVVGDYSGFVNSITVADFNVDGFNDFFLCTQDGRDALFIFNPLDRKFYNEAKNWGITTGGRSYSAVCADFDLNSYPDLYISKYGQDQLYLNGPGSQFREATLESVYAKAGYISGYSTGAALNDIENNGKYDLIIGNTEYWSSLLQNLNKENSYIQMRLHGIQDTREALGARIWIWPAASEHSQQNLIAHQELVLSNGLFSQNWSSLNIGLGVVGNVDVKVRFLNGDEFEFTNIARGASLEIFQDVWVNRQFFSVVRSFLQFLHTPQRILQIARFLFFLLLIFVSIRFLEKRYSWRFAHATIFAVIAIFIYAFFMSATGFFFELLPFAMLASFLGVLVVINEPLYKSNRFQAEKQHAIQEATLALSQTKRVDDAFRTVCNTLAIIQPCNFISLYIYNNEGNYFVRKAEHGLPNKNFPTRFFPERIKVDELLNTASPLSAESGFISEEKFNLPENTRIFPLVRKNVLLGLVFMRPKETHSETPVDSFNDMKNLFLQFAIALDNIRITKSLREQENIAAIGSFSGGIIHNLKNPIEGLRLIVEMLKKECAESDPHKEYIEELSAGIAELKQRLVRSVEVTHGGYEKRETVNINGIIRKLVQNYANFHYTKFDTAFAEDPILVLGDSVKLEFTFENIIQNAIDASGKGKLVEISARRTPNGLAHIEIRDHGCGIDDANFEKIFELFYSTRGKSRGLGLTLTKNIIKNHGGYIDLYSKKNEGTCFSVYLPIQTDKS